MLRLNDGTAPGRVSCFERFVSRFLEGEGRERREGEGVVESSVLVNRFPLMCLLICQGHE